jgi:hypothetical protein
VLRGKFWITPGGVFDVSTTEHKIFARKHMLNLEPGGVDYPQARTDFTWIPRDHEVASLMNKPCVALGAVAYIRRGGDERQYVMQNLGWVRTTNQAFYAWRLDDKTLKLIRASRDFWFTHQGPWAPGAVIDFVETSCWKEGAIPIEYFFPDGPVLKAQALRMRYIKHDWREKA